MNKTKLLNYLNGLEFLDEPARMQCIANYEKLVNSGAYSPESAFAKIKWSVENVSRVRYESRAGINYSLPATQRGKQITSALEEISKETISTDRVARSRAAIKRFRENLSKGAGCTLRSAFCPRETSVLSDDELDEIKARYDCKDANRGNELIKWECFARSHNLKD